MMSRRCSACNEYGLGCMIGAPCTNCGVREVYPPPRRPEPRPEEERRQEAGAKSEGVSTDA